MRRETYVGDWLPEPVVVSADGPGPAGAELADSLSMAFLVLEALSPVEGRCWDGGGKAQAIGKPLARR